MALTKVANRMVEGSGINVLDYIPRSEHDAIRNGTSTYDARADVQAAIDAAMDESSRVLNGLGTAGFPYKMTTVYFPSGSYNVSDTLVMTRASYATCRLEGIGRATIRYTKTTGGACIYVYPNDLGLPLMSNGPQIVNLRLWNDNKSGVGLFVERMTNGLFQGISTYGFDIGVKVEGGIDNIFDFQGQPIYNCNFGMIVQQESPDGGDTWSGIMKPNLTLIKSAYFISNSSNSLIIRRNPDESPTGNSSGSIVTVQDTNFQGNGSGAAISIDYTGEHPTTGTVNVERCWFEGHGPTAISLLGGQCKVSSCFITNSGASNKPFLLQDSGSRFVFTELDAVFGSAPVGNHLVQRADGTSDGIGSQVIARRCKIAGVGIPAPFMGPQSPYRPKDDVKPDQFHTTNSVADKFSSLSGVTASLASGASETMFPIDANTGSRTYIVTARQYDGGQAWRGVWLVQANSAGTTQVTTLDNANLTVSGSGTNIQITNTNPSAMSVTWNAVCIGQ